MLSKHVSIIIVSWNAKEYLLKCISSLINHTFGIDSEIIVVDNASSDGSAEAVRLNYPDVILIRNKDNLGFAKANNIGIKIATGQYIALINSDIEFIDNTLLKMIEYMEINPEIGIMGPQILNPDLTVQPSCEKAPNLWISLCRAFALDNLFPTISRPPHDTIRFVNVIVGCFWVVRATAIERVGLLDEGFFIYAEDFDWCKRFNAAKWKVAYYPNTRAIHYGGASSSNEKMRFNLEMRRAMMRYYGKHLGLSAQFALFIILLVHETIRIAGQCALTLYNKSDRETGLYKIRRSWSGILWLCSFQWIGFKK